MAEIYCPFNGGEQCPRACINYSRNDAEQHMPLGTDLDLLTIKSDIIPGHNQEAKNANFREMRRRACEINKTNSFFRRKK